MSMAPSTEAFCGYSIDALNIIETGNSYWFLLHMSIDCFEKNLSFSVRRVILRYEYAAEAGYE